MAYTPPQTDKTQTGTINSLNGTVSVDLNNYSTLILAVTPTSFVGSLEFQASVDGTTWKNIAGISNEMQERIYELYGTDLATSFKVVKFSIGGYQKFRVIASQYTSGSVSIAMVISPASSDSNVIGKISGDNVYLEDDFAGSTTIDPYKWQTPITGTGQTITQINTNPDTILRISAGTTASQVARIRSQRAFVGEMQARITARLSQRIANQNFYIELVGEDGTKFAQWDFSGTVVTTCATRVSNGASGRVIASTTTLTTASLQVFEIMRSESGIHFSTNAVDSNTSNTIRGTFSYQLPELDVPLYIQFRVVNGGTAPASNTNFDIERIALVSSDTLKMTLRGGSGSGSLMSAIPVIVQSAPSTTVTGTVTATQGTAGATAWLTKINATTATGYTAYKLISGATTNATSVKTSVATLGFVSVTNVSTSVRYLKLYNKASAPTVGTDTPTQVYLIPANGSGTNLAIPLQGVAFPTGLAFAITGGSADNDTTAIGAGEVIVNLGYI